MNWNGKDTALFQQQKEYIDTAVVPLVPVGFEAGMVQSAEQFEFIGLLTAFIEKQFKGRLIVTPPCTYLPDAGDPREQAGQWAGQLAEAGFKHVFFFTSDSMWREKEVGGDVIWVPSIPLSSMDEGVKYSVIESQAKQIVNLIVEKWQAGLK